MQNDWAMTKHKLMILITLQDSQMNDMKDVGTLNNYLNTYKYIYI